MMGHLAFRIFMQGVMLNIAKNLAWSGTVFDRGN
jgi:hypothetical protein